MPVKRISARRPSSRPSREYEIRVRGAIGPTLLGAFPELTARRIGADTILRGSLADPSALYGVIHRLESLALELLEIRCRPAGGHEAGPKSSQPVES
jgi:hypothetical protein